MKDGTSMPKPGVWGLLVEEKFASFDPWLSMETLRFYEVCSCENAALDLLSMDFVDIFLLPMNPNTPLSQASKSEFL